MLAKLHFIFKVKLFCLLSALLAYNLSLVYYKLCLILKFVSTIEAFYKQEVR